MLSVFASILARFTAFLVVPAPCGIIHAGERSFSDSQILAAAGKPAARVRNPIGIKLCNSLISK